MTAQTPLTVYFDGSCPLCRREIDWYRRRPGSDDITWIDVSHEASAAGLPDIDRETALARFHVRLPDGSLVAGAPAFAELWRRLPGFRMLGGIARVPVIEPLLERLYRGFLRLRPALQRSFPERCEASDTGYPRWLERELRANHAGEAGAVAIYRGILVVTRDTALRTFATNHLETEARHLTVMEGLLPRARRSRLLPVWRAAGFVTGALPAHFGPRAVYITVEAVECLSCGYTLRRPDRGADALPRVIESPGDARAVPRRRPDLPRHGEFEGASHDYQGIWVPSQA